MRGLATLEFLDDLATLDVLIAEPKLVSLRLEFPLPSVSMLPPKLLQDEGKFDSEFVSQRSAIFSFLRENRSSEVVVTVFGLGDFS